MGENNNLALNARTVMLFALLIIIFSTFTFVGYANQQEGNGNPLSNHHLRDNSSLFI